MASSTIHLACCFDAAFEAHVTALIHSVARHSSSQVVVHAIHDGSVRSFSVPEAVRSRVSLEFYDAGSLVRGLPVNGPQSTITFARLFLPQLLHGVRKVVYLDADIVVRRDLAPLWSDGASAAAVGAVLDYPLLLLAERKRRIGSDPSYRTGDYIRGFLGLKAPERYFNAGVLVIDIDRFADAGVLDRAVDFLDRKGRGALFNDQDALNVALQGDFQVLDPRWNFMPQYAGMVERLGPTPDALAVLRDCSDDPWVIHYAGEKPWQPAGAPNRWEVAYIENLLAIEPLDAKLAMLHYRRLMEYAQRLENDQRRLLSSPGRLAKACSRLTRWKLGLRRTLT